jgi:ribosomal protein S18 acetylase RimI-like enzyme
MTPDPARPDELPAAFALIFQHLGDADRRERVGRAQALVEQGELDPRGVLVARGPEELLAALVCATVPGAGALIWPPASKASSRPEVEDALVQRACTWLRGQGARLAQCLLPPVEAHLADPLLRNGFTQVTHLAYLEHDLAASTFLHPSSERLRVEPYDPDRPDEFHRTLQASYEQTLDCPEVNGVRAIDEVIAGHRAQGRFDPSWWWLAHHDGTPVGILLLIEQADPGEWEVAYMGIVPAARRRGFGQELLLKGMRELRLAGARRVLLSVDERNRPAWDLYRAVGFLPYDSRVVYLSVWR